MTERDAPSGDVVKLVDELLSGSFETMGQVDAARDALLDYIAGREAEIERLQKQYLEMLDELRGLSENATPGPWTPKSDWRRDFPWRVEGRNETAHVFEVNRCKLGKGEDLEAEANAKLAAFAVNYVRSMLAAQPAPTPARQDSDAVAAEPYTPPLQTCPKCKTTAMAHICSEVGCPMNGGAAYPWTNYSNTGDA